MKVMRIFLRALTAVYCALLLLLCLPVLPGIHVYAVLSPSMAPAIPTGAAVFVEKEMFEKIRVGDVITYALDGSETYVTHRVAEKDEAKRCFVTKGDANAIEDAKTVPYAQVIGRVSFRVPYLGYPLLAAASLRGKVVLLGGLAALLLVQRVLEADNLQEC